MWGNQPIPAPGHTLTLGGKWVVCHRQREISGLISLPETKIKNRTGWTESAAAEGERRGHPECAQSQELERSSREVLQHLINRLISLLLSCTG